MMEISVMRMMVMTIAEVGLRRDTGDCSVTHTQCLNCQPAQSGKRQSLTEERLSRMLMKAKAMLEICHFILHLGRIFGFQILNCQTEPQFLLKYRIAIYTRTRKNHVHAIHLNHQYTRRACKRIFFEQN